MGWFNNRLMRGATNRAYDRLALEYGTGPASGILALAMGHACYPNATYGDNGPQDEIVKNLKIFELSPQKNAYDYVESWMDKNELSTQAAFIAVWGVNQDQFLERFIEGLD